MANIKSPMLGVNVDLSTLKYPVICSPKIDGVRAYIKDSIVYSRTGKPIPNERIQLELGKPEYEGFDGELTAGPRNSPTLFRDTTASVMNIHCIPRYTFNIFDCFKNDVKDRGWEDRMISVIANFPIDVGYIIPAVRAKSENDLLNFEQAALHDGYEGIMIRNPNEPYKFGRSTIKEQGLLKLKRFSDAEADVIDVVQLVNKDGNTENKLGSIIVKDPDHWKETFSIGSGFSDKERKYFWDNPDKIISKKVKYKYFDYGSYDKPRFPIFIGLRSPLDI